MGICVLLIDNICTPRQRNCVEWADFYTIPIYTGYSKFFWAKFLSIVIESIKSTGKVLYNIPYALV